MNVLEDAYQRTFNDGGFLVCWGLGRDKGILMEVMGTSGDGKGRSGRRSMLRFGGLIHKTK